MEQLQAISCWFAGWLGLILFLPYLPKAGSCKASLEVNLSPNRRLSDNQPTTSTSRGKLPVYMSVTRIEKRDKLSDLPVQSSAHVIRGLKPQRTGDKLFEKPPHLPVQITARKIVPQDDKPSDLKLHISAQKIPRSALNRRYRLIKAIKKPRDRKHDLAIGQNWKASYKKGNLKVNIKKTDIKVKNSEVPGILIVVLNELVKVLLTIISWLL